MGIIIAYIKLATVLERRGNFYCLKKHHTAALHAIRCSKECNKFKRRIIETLKTAFIVIYIHIYIEIVIF